ncbi:hypothetical protein [Streptomyces capitiformicae]|nr:hypothetical protein [Streptomyces capitiformicae]
MMKLRRLVFRIAWRKAGSSQELLMNTSAELSNVNSCSFERPRDAAAAA